MGADRSDISGEYFYRFNCHTESVFNRGMADASCGHRIPFQRCDRPHYNHYVSKKASEYYVDGKAEETDEEIK